MRQTDEETKIAAYIVAEVLVQDIKSLEGRSGMVFIAPRLHTHGTALYAAEYVFSLLSPCIASLRTSDRKMHACTHAFSSANAYSAEAFPTAQRSSLRFPS